MEANRQIDPGSFISSVLSSIARIFATNIADDNKKDNIKTLIITNLTIINGNNIDAKSKLAILKAIGAEQAKPFLPFAFLETKPKVTDEQLYDFLIKYYFIQFLKELEQQFKKPTEADEEVLVSLYNSSIRHQVSSNKPLQILCELTNQDVQSVAESYYVEASTEIDRKLKELHDEVEKYEDDMKNNQATPFS